MFVHFHFHAIHEFDAYGMSMPAPAMPAISIYALPGSQMLVVQMPKRQDAYGMVVQCSMLDVNLHAAGSMPR